ncbi:SDR family oxidoreductase [Pseudomonas mediterranea]|jgi:NAD(P)-dependent dehydrogenase (short-subunit alcohol dehydrogenase family)|uniref:NAD(P)-dependent dehydrogenase, short-chain alcohol dehydrogenase family n=1 Tax=Pseudomonas mediterranea TaxID=183795 RepID=A0AAX2DGC9_9PSED|nr:SDR family oxidoreductase [Pseudomonas mediterranea]KGU82116.1 3-beta hydroxysteroid dehydrogenase [Pseudomonas mediterranea CFBP 5447]SDU69680.1 NAD(P)-dependent dehydrogenase, short-chain alcohol dehydrogenase family [Pseudomonas mediterranea]
MKRLEGKVALISGAASGIGAASAIRFAEEGAGIVICDVDETKAGAVLETIRALGGKVLFCRLDVRDENQWAAAFMAALAQFGSVDIVMNSAGIAVAGDVETMSFDDWNKELSVNLHGTFLGMKQAFEHLREKGGSIINLSSIEGIVGHPGYVAYCAGKGAIRNLTKSAALHAGRKGYRIRVNSIHPGYITTPMVGNDPVELERLRRLHPIGFLGEAIDIANMALFLASDESRFATGAEFVIDGGFLAQ